MGKVAADLTSQISVKVSAIVVALLLVFAVQAALVTGAPAGNERHTDAAIVNTPTPPADTLPPDEVNNGGVTAVGNSTSGDPVHGAQLFKTFNPKAGIACASCHMVNKDDRLVGPGLMTIGTRAGTRVAGLTAAQYIRQSIVDPTAYVVDGYQPIMPKTFGKAFSDLELNDLVAYLLTLK
ncbi:MAG: c-type cytochrome [Anaerolineae bacterium]|nr:c-type cytochrome [Anaerolineae bacterium]